MEVKKPNAPSAVKALVFGIISLATMCLPIVPLVFGILGFNFGKKAVNECTSNPEAYGGEGMGNAGKIMGLIGLIIGAVGIVVWIFYFSVLIALFTGASYYGY
ncbi:MAG: hypothetical protein KGZ97_11160 [Bacteroidetes bacterium]|nr:hypothetical protein [Bacteroidota bacterium]